MSRSKTRTKKASPDPAPVIAKLNLDDLHHTCDPSSLGFKTTDELPTLTEVIGQPRAFRAMELGTEVLGPGFNIFVLGLPGSGKTTLIRQYLERKASSEPISDDWCYVNNFVNPHEPKALRLPAGRGIELRKEIQSLLAVCRQELIRIFESKEYNEELSRLKEVQEESAEKELAKLNEQAAKYNFLLARTPFGFMLVPAVDGKPIQPADLEKLSPEQREKLRGLENKLQDEVKSSLTRVRKGERETQEQIRELDTRTALYAVGHLIDELKVKYEGLDQVISHLESVQENMIANIDQLRSPEPDSQSPLTQLAAPNLFQRYDVNVIVDNSERDSAPVVVENHPSYQNLIGRIEHEVVMGGSRTNFTMIQPGALHRANGGYLILPARDVLLNTYAWEGLKRALREESIRIINLGAQLGLMSTVSLEPEPIPLDVKIVLIGTPMLFYLLRGYDEDFPKLFKVKAEFATTMDRTTDTEHEYALFVKAVVDANQLPTFASTAVAEVIEYGSRLAEDQGKLSTRFGEISDLIRESAYWSKKMEEDIVSGTAVEKAVKESIYRSNLIEERLQERISDETLLIDVTGETVGQVNALSVLQMGDYAFGRPTRVTATVHPGQDGVVDIEREAKLGGRIHTKGVLIIGGFLGARYGQKQPLNLSAAVTFEQSYEDIEGDSASAAELFALLSAISEIPLRQDLAITGSVNQHGQIQAVGGINEKIEGFFKACKVKGISGSQGVIIPKGNVANLMLDDEVIQSVADGEFHIWPITTIDEGLTLLTGKESGKLREDGSYPEGSFNHVASERLAKFTEVVRAAAGEPSESTKEDEEES
ncbi:MAG TPA: AAA family ATPase [Anaerolineae bacterium]|nr:AAA family ATPase [Anaerolineae bacterium]